MIILSGKYRATQIIRKLEKYQCVSFDIFDTLVKRCAVSPEDIFLSVAHEYNLYSDQPIDAEEFVTDRITASKAAQSNAVENGYEERTINEIYECLSEKYGDRIERLKTIEKKRELQCAKANPEMKEVYDWCVERGKDIYIISDMYLMIDTIEEILYLCGYTQYKKIFLSSELRIKKSTGTLFEYVLDELGVKGSGLVHIGDNLSIDYIQAKKNNLSSIKIPKNRKYTHYGKRLFHRISASDYRYIQNITGNFTSREWNPYFEYGFAAVGPLMYGLCVWLHNRAKIRGCEKLFFLSRDGYLMQKAYGSLYGELAIPNKYLYVSRKSLSRTQLWINPDPEDIFEQEKAYRFWNVYEICELIDIDIDVGVVEWEHCGLSREERILRKDLLNDKRVINFLENLKTQMIDNSKSKFDEVVDYLKQEEFTGSVAIVDIGWVGSIQKYMQRIVNEAGLDVSLYGYYLGFKPETVIGESEAESYIPRDKYPNMFCSNLMEYPFTKTVGSTSTYLRENDGSIVPVLMEYEFKDMPDFKYTEEMQDGIIYFVELMKAGYDLKGLHWEAGYYNVKNVTKYPRRFDVDLLGDLAHYNHGTCLKAALPDKMIHYLKDPDKLKVDLSDCGWKIGFLKRLFKIPLPYNSMLELIRRREFQGKR